MGYSVVGLSYEAVVSQGEHWRLITLTFSHISFLHLLSDMSALWSLGIVEVPKTTPWETLTTYSAQ